MLRVLGVVRAERPAPNNQSALALVAGQPPAFLWLSILFSQPQPTLYTAIPAQSLSGLCVKEHYY